MSLGTARMKETKSTAVIGQQQQRPLHRSSWHIGSGGHGPHQLGESLESKRWTGRKGAIKHNCIRETTPNTEGSALSHPKLKSSGKASIHPVLA